MDDSSIVGLYLARDEAAVAETQAKYGNYLQSLALRVTGSAEDAQECVNDAYLSAWNSIPPNIPENLPVFLGRIVRRTAVSAWRKNHAGKRGGCETTAVLDELEECVPSASDVAGEVEAAELSAAISRFLRDLPDDARRVFVCRYWYMEPVADISGQFGFTQSKVKSMLARTRGRLREYLKREGYYEG